MDDNLFCETSLTLPNSLSNTLSEPLDNVNIREPAPKLGPELHNSEPEPDANANAELEASNQQAHATKVVYDAQGDVVEIEGLPADLYPELIIDSLLHNDDVAFPAFLESILLKPSEQICPLLACSILFSSYWGRQMSC